MKNEIDIVYYSGTGGTKLVAETFVNMFMKYDWKCSLQKVTEYKYSFFGKGEALKDSLLLVLFPVHAANAPEPVYKFKQKRVRFDIVRKP